jgi:glycosyltransferase involved in cell wall biosynthesis
MLPASDPGDPIEVVAFTAAHRRAVLDAALDEFGLPGLDPVRLCLPRPVLYDAWNNLGAPPLGLVHRRLRDVDVVHAPSLAVPPRTRVPLIVTVHDAAPLLFPETSTRRGRRFHARGFAAAAKRADLVIAVSHAAADEVAAHTAIPRDRMRVIHHGVDQEIADDGAVAQARAALGLGADPYVLWVGTLEPRKNVGVLIEAFGAVAREGDLAHRLVVVGPRGWSGTADVVRERAEALGGRVVLTGSVGSGALRALYRGADVFAFPSLHEGFGMPLLEAMAQETAVVCSDLAVFHEVAGEAARYVAPNDVDGWAQALAVLCTDDEARAGLAVAGRARASTFTWARCIGRTRDVYRELL